MDGVIVVWFLYCTAMSAAMWTVPQQGWCTQKDWQ